MVWALTWDLDLRAVTQDPRQIIGELGEQLATRYLRKRGYRILARNYSTDSGEADIVAYDHGIIAFVEVKTRTSAEFGPPEDAITSHKMSQMSRVARQYASHFRLYDTSWRYDCVLITMGKPAPVKGFRRILGKVLPFLVRPKAEIQLIQNAFTDK
jgi:putative endonuclease